MSPLQKSEITTVLIIIAISAVIGSVFNLTLLFVSLALFVYIILMLRNTFKLHDWLTNPHSSLPEASGFWGEIFNELYLMRREGNKQKNRLKKALKRFKKAAEALPDGAVILSSDNKIEWSNPVACSLLGINHPQDNGQKIYNLIRHPDFQNYLNNHKYGKQITLPSPENIDHTITLQIIPFAAKQKMILCRDISHIIKLEEMRSNFVSNVSHEMRSPLTVLSGYLEIFIDHPPKDNQKFQETIESMYQQTVRMERLVSDLLSLSKMETRTLEHKSIVNVNAMLVGLKENAELMSKDKHHHIKLEMDDNLSLLGNNDELHSLFSNLISNAVRYTQAEGEIKISWKKTDKGAIFSVSDTGPGIAAQHIPHITERFYRVDAHRSRDTGGTGLGLAIVKHALERHDGQLNIVSQLGKGTTFSCYFPLHRICMENK